MKLRLGTYRLRLALLRRTAPRSGVLARRLRHPNPFAAPWRQPILDVVRDGAIGDVLMCTPALRTLKRRRPNCHIRFYTSYPSFLRGLPYIDEVLPTSSAPPGAVHLKYEHVIPPRAHLARILGDNLGLRAADVRPDCAIDPALVERFREEWRELPRPHIVISRRASNWTPNKDWPQASWVELIGRLTHTASVIEIGASTAAAVEDFGTNYVDLRGRTSLDEFAAAIAASDLHIGPVSAPVHIAAAAGKRSVLIIGGYEQPANTVYPGNIALYTPVSCAPCWLRSPCPHQLRCLNAISPRIVEKTVLSLWRDIRDGG